MKEIEMIGKTFGRLTVIAPGKSAGKNKHWICICQCGNQANVNGYYLRKGITKSCGCLARERRIERNTKHGMRKTRLYRIYCNMKTRCYNPNRKDYGSYGGRGIKICNEWLGKNGFQNFMEWSLANGYADNLSIDRRDGNGNYEPSNCRWVDMYVQAFNRRRKSTNTTGHTGVYLHRGKYEAQIMKKGEIYYLGTFNTYEEAVEARERAEKELY